MTMMIVTFIVEFVSLISLHAAVRERKTKYLKWILGVVTGVTQVVFWYFAIQCMTVYLAFEIVLEIVIVLWCVGIVKMNTPEKKKILKCLEWLGLVVVLLVILLTSFPYTANIRWSEPTTKIEKKTFGVPENLKEFDVKFQCIHNSKEGRYDLYQIWNNGICKIASYPEDKCKVYRLPDSSSYLPRVETTVKTKCQYNYNFDAFQEPTLEDTFKEETYELYVSESSYKEDYTD